MKAGTEAKLKFKTLQRALSLKLWGARGLLDTLWSFTQHNAPRGDIGRFSDEEIAIGIDWDNAAELIEALVKHRWLDRVGGPDRLLVHDWPDHCEDSVHMALARKGLLFACGARPKLSRLSKDEREAAIPLLEAAERALSACASKETHGVHTENALPSHALPSHALAKPSLATAPRTRTSTDAIDRAEEFLEVWNKTPGTRRCPDQFALGRADLLLERFGDPAWLANYPKALAKFPLKPFGPDGMSVSKFLEEDTVPAILSGKYDFTPTPRDGPKQRPGGPPKLSERNVNLKGVR